MSSYPAFEAVATLTRIRMWRSGLSQKSQESQAAPDSGWLERGDEKVKDARPRRSCPPPSTVLVTECVGGQEAGAFTALERELFEERAAIMEYDGGLSRAKAERLARASILRTRAERPTGAGPF